jgi:hypothetical protein
VDNQNFDATYCVGIRTHGLQTCDSRPCRFPLGFEEREESESEIEEERKRSRDQDMGMNEDERGRI